MSYRDQVRAFPNSRVVESRQRGSQPPPTLPRMADRAADVESALRRSVSGTAMSRTSSLDSKATHFPFGDTDGLVVRPGVCRCVIAFDPSGRIEISRFS